MDDLFEYQWARSYMTDGELILWTGKPGRGHLLSVRDIFMIPFSILWCGFAVFWEYSAIKEGAPFFFPIFGGFFVLVGLYITVGRFLVQVLQRRRTEYVITTRSILRRRGGRVDVLPTNRLPEMRVDARRDGSGSIFFGSKSYGRWTWYSSEVDFFGIDKRFSIEAVDDINRVVEIIRSADWQ